MRLANRKDLDKKFFDAVFSVIAYYSQLQGVLQVRTFSEETLRLKSESKFIFNSLQFFPILQILERISTLGKIFLSKTSLRMQQLSMWYRKRSEKVRRVLFVSSTLFHFNHNDGCQVLAMLEEFISQQELSRVTDFQHLDITFKNESKPMSSLHLPFCMIDHFDRIILLRNMLKEVALASSHLYLPFVTALNDSGENESIYLPPQWSPRLQHRLLQKTQCMTILVSHHVV